MSSLSDTWTAGIVAGTPVDAAELVSIFNAIQSSVNNVANTQITGVDGSKLVDLSVATAKLANNAVTTAKINTAAITDALLDYTSVKVLRTAHTTSKKIIWGTKQVVVGAVAQADFAIVFSTDSSVAGATQFSSATGLIVLATPFRAAGAGANDKLCIQQNVAASATGVTFNVFKTDGTNISLTVNVNWIAIGPA